MNFNIDESSIPQISEVVTTAIEQAQRHIEAGNNDQARAVLQDAEEKASNSDEYGLIAGIVLSDLGDENWGQAILSKAVELAPSATSLATLSSHALQIGDMDLARNIMKDAEARTTSVSDAMGAASIAEVFGDDQTIAEGLYVKAESLASTCNDFVLMAQGTAFTNPDRTRTYLERAVALVKGPEDQEAVANTVEEYMSDEEWAGKIRAGIAAKSIPS